MDTKKYVAVGLIVVVILIYTVSFLIKKTEETYIASLQNLIIEEQVTLNHLSDLTDKNTVDTYAGGVIADCPQDERVRFDELLGTLDLLDKPELIELNQLFTGCAFYDAEQKALMTVRLKREVEIYTSLVNVLVKVDSDATANYHVEEWTKIADFEEQRTEISQKLVQIQKDIVLYLLDNKDVSSPEIISLLQQAQEEKETFSYLRIKIDALRTQIQKT